MHTHTHTNIQSVLPKRNPWNKKRTNKISKCSKAIFCHLLKRQKIIKQLLKRRCANVVGTQKLFMFIKAVQDFGDSGEKMSGFIE